MTKLDQELTDLQRVYVSQTTLGKLMCMLALCVVYRERDVQTTLQTILTITKWYAYT